MSEGNVKGWRSGRSEDPYDGDPGHRGARDTPRDALDKEEASLAFSLTSGQSEHWSDDKSDLPRHLRPDAGRHIGWLGAE